MKKIILATVLSFVFYFAQAQITFVNPAAVGLNNGTSWANAYTNLQTALTSTPSGSIWVVAGTHYPGASGANAATFSLKNGIQLLGGFIGGESGPTQRDPDLNLTILSGDLDVSGTFTGNDAYHVVSAVDVNSSAVLDGFVITGGNAPSGQRGGGVYCDVITSGTFDPIIRNCDISYNYGDHGGGIEVFSWYTANGYNSPQFINCEVHHNTAFGWGGGVHISINGANAYGAPKFENVLFYADSSQTGGVIGSEHANGGRIDALFVNCTFGNNPSMWDIVYQTYATPGSFTFHNSIFYGNLCNTDAFFVGDNNSTDLSAAWGSGTGNVSMDPLFVNAGASNYHLSCTSPLINAGNNSHPIQIRDLDDSIRISQTTVDMGAYETNYTPPTVVAMASSTSICIGDVVTLTGSGALSYIWDNGATDGSPFSPASTTLYNVTGTDANGCTGVDAIIVAVNPLPTVGANSDVPGVCLGANVILSGTGASFYSWDNGVTDMIPFAPAVTTLYTVTGTDGNGCINTANINIPVESSIGFTAGPDVDVCRSGTPYVTLTGGNNGGNAFSWSTLGSGSWGNFGTMTPDYYLSGADASGASVQIVLEIYHSYCPYEHDTLVLYMQDPTSSFAGADVNVCSDFASSVPVNGFASSYSSILWTTSGTGSFVPDAVSMSTSYAPSPGDISAGTVTLTFTSSALNPACPNVGDGLLLNIHPSPLVTLPADYTICETDSIYLNGTITGGTPPFIYNWNDGIMTTISTANNEYYFPSATDSYTMTATDTYGCGSSGLLTVTVDASETLSGNLNVGAGSLTDGVMYILKFSVQQLAFDTFFVYPFSAGAGSYSFPSMPHGNYLIKVVPDTTIFPNLLPTYYGDAFQWDSATVINHSCTGSFVADINMIALLGGSGTGTISGEIREGDGFGTRMMSGHNQIFTPGGPLKGVDVKLGKNPGGGIQARTMSDSTGYYEFTNLPDDSYRIYVDIPGLPMDSFYVVNVQADSTIDLDYFADSNSVFPILPTAVGINEYANGLSSSVSLYPNPASNYTSIIFESQKENTAAIRVIDITGKQLMNIQLRNLPKGKHEYQLNFAERFVSGIYFVEVVCDGIKEVKKLVVE